MPLTTNPLRYPGAKRTLTDYIETLLIVNNLDGCHFIEPYAGSAAVGLSLLQRKIIKSLDLCEKDILLYAFWKCVFEKTNDLCNLIQDTPITIDTWKKLEPYRKSIKITKSNILYFGFSGLFFNRTNFSGILNANPIGGIEQKSKYDISCRFNKTKIINIIKDLSKYKNKVNIFLDDAIDFTRSQAFNFITQSCFVYFDPPYYGKGRQIYRHYYNKQDHIAFSKFVRTLKCVDWIISYDDDPFVCNLYGDSETKYRPLFLDYSCAARVRTTGKELLISNLPLPPFKIGNVVGL
jgi:DNA adenine methylase